MRITQFFFCISISRWTRASLVCTVQCAYHYFFSISINLLVNTTIYIFGAHNLYVSKYWLIEWFFSVMVSHSHEIFCYLSLFKQIYIYLIEKLPMDRNANRFPLYFPSNLNSGGRFCSFSPCIEQSQRCCEALQENGFVEIQSMEVLQIEDVVKTKNVPLLEFEFVKHKVNI